MINFYLPRQQYSELRIARNEAIPISMILRNPQIAQDSSIPIFD